MSKKKPEPIGEAYKIRSICFDDVLLSEIETARLARRMSRSEFVRAVLEQHFGILEHPELELGPTKATTRPITKGVRGPSKKL